MQFKNMCWCCFFKRKILSVSVRNSCTDLSTSVTSRLRLGLISVKKEFRNLFWKSRYNDMISSVLICIVIIHEMEIITVINKTRTIKVNEDLEFCLCDGSEKSRFEWLHKLWGVLMIFLNFSYDEEFTVSFISF